MMICSIYSDMSAIIQYIIVSRICTSETFYFPCFARNPHLTGWQIDFLSLQIVLVLPFPPPSGLPIRVYRFSAASESLFTFFLPYAMIALFCSFLFRIPVLTTGFSAAAEVGFRSRSTQKKPLILQTALSNPRTP